MAILTALSVCFVALIHFPIFPAVAFLEYDPADIPILICGFAFGPAAGFIVTLIAAFIQGFTVSAQSGIYGIIMHIVATGAYVLSSSLFYRKHSGTVSAVLSLMPFILLFNLIKAGANGAITFFIYKRVKHLFFKD